MLCARFRPRGFASLPGWSGSDHRAAFAAFRRSAGNFLQNTVKTGELGVPAEAFIPAARAALEQDASCTPEARDFFEAHFRPALVDPGEERARGFLTGYYEPEVEASRTRTAHFAVPLYRRPADLEKVDDVSRPAGLDPYFRFARRRSDGLLDEYPDRAAIMAGYLEGRGLEIAWLEDPVDAFFIHVQGSARLRFPDGGTLRVGYAAKTGHPFTAIGRILVESGELTLDEADMAGIRAWLAAHPDRVRPLLNRNRSFIFFTESPVDDPALGPVGAAGLSLTPQASIAVDRVLHTFGMPVFIDAPALEMSGAPFRRLTIAQDTGSAIVGPARADLFVGSGAAAGAIAGRIRHGCDLFALLPKALLAGAAL